MNNKHAENREIYAIVQFGHSELAGWCVGCEEIPETGLIGVYFKNGLRVTVAPQNVIMANSEAIADYIVPAKLRKYIDEESDT